MTTAQPYTAGMAKQVSAGDWPRERIIALRLRLKESVSQFGARFGRSGRTVEDWEQGRRNPDVMVLLALERLEKRQK